MNTYFIAKPKKGLMMKLKNEKKVIGTLVSGLNAVSLDLRSHDILLKYVKAGDYKKALEITDMFFVTGQIREHDYKALKFVFISAYMMWADV